MDGWKDGWMDGWEDGRMDGWMDKRKAETTKVGLIFGNQLFITPTLSRTSIRPCSLD